MKAKIKNPQSAIRNPQSKADLLVEIGTEELPAAYLDGAIEELRQETERLFRDAHLEFAAVETVGTPRRLVLVIRALRRTQHNPPEEIRGPSKQAAFDPGGKPTSALAGFLRARGGTVSQTKIVRTEKGDYVYLLKPARQIPTVQVLPRFIEQVIGRLHVPKTMRWDDSAVRFARPIRWLLVLYGSKPVGVSVGRLKSGRHTWVGGPKRPMAVSVTSAAKHSTLLNRHGILVDHRKRKQRIEQLVTTWAKKHGGVPAPEIMTHGLFDEVTHLVEQPVALVGQFNPKYLALPREVLLASMAKYQRVFAMQASSGKLLPRFVAMLDGAPKKIAQVRHMYEHILNARLADSLLFWKQDHKQLPLDRMATQLKDVSVHERLGSMQQKTERLEHLSAALAKMWSFSAEESAQLRRACRLAKADLVSTMVKEFPTLQGVVGRYYARESKEPEAVAKAIGEQYLPAGADLPETLLGGALSLLDKYDTLASYFAIGIMPTGDQDPFGLRRAAQGIVEIAWKVHKPLLLDELLDTLFDARQFIPPAVSLSSEDQRKIKEQLGHKVKQYLFERLYTFAWPAPAPSRDLIDAVLDSASDDLVDTMDRIRALRQMDGKQSLLRAAKVVERTSNILKPATVRQATVDPETFQDPLERTLWDLYQTGRERVLGLIQKKAYAEATEAYGETFFDPLHEFFERVMVNVPDEALQQNRLALMKAINVLYTDHVADLSKLAILQPRQTS